MVYINKYSDNLYGISCHSLPGTQKNLGTFCSGNKEKDQNYRFCDYAIDSSDPKNQIPFKETGSTCSSPLLEATRNNRIIFHHYRKAGNTADIPAFAHRCQYGGKFLLS